MITAKIKIKRSLAAMGRGWIACNALLLAIVLMQEGPATFSGPMLIAFIYWLYTGAVIFMAWLLVFLPVDLAVPETSSLRRPGAAALCGASGGCLPYAVWIGISFISNPQSFDLAQWSPLNEDLATWLFLLAPPLTGLTAALTLVRRHPRQEHSNTQSTR